MIISGVPDCAGGAGEGSTETQRVPGDDSHEYQTASELFELMAKNQNFHSNDVDSLTTRDLVLLYKNIDLGTKLMSNANGFNPKKPNQYIETVVYDDMESDSDISEIYSNEDIHNVVLINKERIDLLNDRSSLRHVLCHKFGDLEIQSLDVNTQYDKKFLFKDPYIKEQLKSLNLVNDYNGIEEPILPASLLDYICCKRLEDNYNFYMDNVIRYVQHTIEQLKRISNGDYLTEKAKEKWREMENNFQDMKESKECKVLATSTSIPLQVEHKGGPLSTWKNIVHSEVDLRSLSKTLEKKIIVEIPKLIFGSYQLLNKCGADNLIISCKTDQESVEETRRKSRVDVVFQLQRSDSQQVISNLSSILILQTTTTMQTGCLPTRNNVILESPVQHNDLKVTTQNKIAEEPSYNIFLDVSSQKNVESNVKIMGLDYKDNPRIESRDEKEVSKKDKKPSISDNFVTEESYLDSIDYFYSNNLITSVKDHTNQDSNESSNILKHYFDKTSLDGQNEASFKLVTPDELRVTMHRLNLQSAFTEESGEDILSLPTNTKNKSPTRVRIKSPYENKSYLIEEKKRKRLLEIRERREKNKIALAENCKITKHKYGIMPQHSSSVTRLSITNKSFYDSIYGQNSKSEIQKPEKGKNRKGVMRQSDLELVCAGTEVENHCPILSPDKDSKKYTDRSYYLDDAVTEIMYMDMKKNENKDLSVKEVFSTSASEVSNDFRGNINLLSQLIGSSVTDVANAEINIKVKSPGWNILSCVEDNNNQVQHLTASQGISNIAPANSLTKFDINDETKNKPKKTLSSVECRKSIDKIYELLEKLGNPENIESRASKIKLRGGNIEKLVVVGGKESSTIQGSDSGTSLKHRLTSSNPSCYSFEKCNNTDSKLQNVQGKKVNTPTAIVPKVIISSKSQISQVVAENHIKEHKKKRMSDKVTENPLKAISQLLHEFENVQKTRHKSAVEHKASKKPDSASTANCKLGIHQNVTKRSYRLEQRLRDNAGQFDRSPKVVMPRDKKLKQPNTLEVAKNQQNNVVNKQVDKITKNKVADLIDEVKEARGEAVRGPSKLNTRLNTLAQPKRSYVLAHSEEYQYKYGRNLMADRLQRLATTPSPTMADKYRGAAFLKNRARRNEPVSAVSVKTPSPPVPPLERTVRFRRSANSSPSDKEKKSPGHGPPTKQNNVFEAPETMKKMVAVETYVKNHYGSVMSPVRKSGPQQSTQMARVPVLPTDLELDSGTPSISPNEESSSLGNKLHRIVDTIINTPHGLGVLTECHESNSRTSKDDINNYFPIENLSRSDERNLSTDSEYNVDIFEDKYVLTAVEDIEKVSNTVDRSSQETKNSPVSELRTTSSASQLEKLENALSQRISLGIFQKRLRMKNLTLTPKQSMQRVVLLQSGDAGTGSLVIKSAVSQNLTISSETEVLSHLKTLPVFSKSHLDWSYSKFPMQVTTVGYAFPQYKSVQADSKSIKYLNETSLKGTIESLMFDKDSQCYKGEHIQPQSARQNNRKYMTLSKVISITHVVSEQSKIINRSEEPTETSQPKDPSMELKSFRETDKSTRNTKAQTTITTVYKNAETNQSENLFKKSILNSQDKRAETSQFENSNLSKDTTETKVMDKYPDNAKSIITGLGKNEITTSCESVDYTTSLDILVGLLNEIKKITTCQTHITTNNGIDNNDADFNELETILSNAAALDGSKNSPLDILSLTSLEKLRQLESNASLYSFYLSDHGEDDVHRKKELKPEAIPKIIYVDKEIGVDFAESKLVDTLTDVPSKFLPISRSTNITNSLIGLISVPSTQSLISFSVNSESSMNPIKNIIKLPVTGFKDHKQTLNTALVTEVNENFNPGKEIPGMQILPIQKNTKLQQNVKLIRSKCYEGTEFDSSIKMKRDILVTVYSILVFSVFAAMSFPRLLMSDIYF